MSATTHQFHMHHDPADQVGKRERLGVRLLILADGSFVFGMIFSYLYLRNLDVNGGWLPNNGTVMDMQSGWMVALPFIVAAISHALGTTAKAGFKFLSLITLGSLAYGSYLQYLQLSAMPFLNPETGHLEGAYASTWLLMGGANMFHYGLSIFLALGLAIRAYRSKVEAELEAWRLATAQSWFTWAAISASACALTLMLV